MINLYALMSDRVLEKTISDREYQKNVLKGYLASDLPISIRNDYSLELALIRKDLTRLYDEKRLRSHDMPSSMLSQTHLEIEMEG